MALLHISITNVLKEYSILICILHFTLETNSQEFLNLEYESLFFLKKWEGVLTNYELLHKCYHLPGRG